MQSMQPLPVREEVSATGQERCSAGDPSCLAHSSCGRGWELSGFQATHPVRLPRSATPAELMVPVPPVLPLLHRKQRLRRDVYIEATASRVRGG